MSPEPLTNALIATYQVAFRPDPANPAKLETMARQIAIGQSIGTAKAAEVELLAPYMAQVVSVEELPTAGSADTETLALVRVAFPADVLKSDLGTLLTVLFGKLSMAGKVRLVDIEPPASLVTRFQGPRFGVEGIRQRLIVPERPLLMSIFKPCLGLPEQTLADLLYSQAIAGMDFVKDDEILSDPDFETARRRLAACLVAAERAKRETGNTLLYAINLTGPAEELLQRARTLVREGATALLFNYLSYGLPMLNALRNDPEITVPLVAHPSLAGAFYGSPAHGVSPQVIFGILPRLAGADMVLFPSPYGSVALPMADAQAVAGKLGTPVPGLKPTLPVPSAGITAAMIPDIIADFGHNVVINAGTGIHDHPEGSLAGAQNFRRLIEEQSPSLTAGRS